jgi:hypothetical protein
VGICTPEDVDLGKTRHELARAGRGGEVESDAVDLRGRVRRAQAGNGFGDAGFGAAVDGDAGTLGGEGGSGGEADAGGGTGDERLLVGKAEVHGEEGGLPGTDSSRNDLRLPRATDVSVPDPKPSSTRMSAVGRRRERCSTIHPCMPLRPFASASSGSWCSAISAAPC